MSNGTRVIVYAKSMDSESFTAIKRGFVARENSKGVWVWDPNPPPNVSDRPETAEWFPWESKNCYTVKV